LQKAIDLKDEEVALQLSVSEIVYVYLLVSLNILKSSQYEPLFLIIIEESGLTWHLMIHHVNKWDQTIGIFTINTNCKHSTPYQNHCSEEFIKLELLEFWDLVTDSIIHLHHTAFYDIYKLTEWAAFKPFKLFVRKGNREVAYLLWP
jgi:hypothetical protein